MDSPLSEETYEVREFVDALREFLGKRPLYFDESRTGVWVAEQPC